MKVGIRPVIHDHQQEGADPLAAVSRRLSTCRHSLLGHPIPAQELSSPHGRPAGTRGSGPGRGYRVPHTRAAAGVGASYSPGIVVLTPGCRSWTASTRRITTTKSLDPATTTIHAGLRLTSHQRRFTYVRPSGLPLTCSPRMEREPLGFPSSFAPRDYSQRTSRAGTGQQSTDPGQRSTTSVLASNPCIVHSWCATSRRTDPSDRVPTR